MRDILIEFMDSIREYVAESGTNIAHDERDSSEFVDIFLNQGQSLPIDSVSGCFPSEKEVEEAAESFADLYMYEADFARGCEAGWNAGANWMKEKYKDTNNR